MTDGLVRARVNQAHFDLPAECVLEVAPRGDIAPVPGAPRALLGVQGLRGDLLPVIDLGEMHGVTSTAVRPRVLVAVARGRRVGFLVDEVLDMSGEAGDGAQAHVRSAVRAIDPEALVAELEAMVDG